MKRVGLAPALAAAACLWSAGDARGGDDPPAWLVAASKVPVAERSDGAPAVELLRECRVRVEPNGTFVTTTRRAVRILAREGKEAAVVREVYETGSGNVQDMRAWVLRPAGKPIAYGKKEVIDASLTQDNLHSETRVRILTAADDVEVGSVFGSESVVEFRQATPQFPWSFQHRLPVLTSRFVMTAPSGWSFRSRTFDHDPIEPRPEGDASVWATGELPYLKDERWSPPLTSLAPRIAVTVLPPLGASQWPQLTDWSAVAHWFESLAEPQSKPTPALTGKALALTDGKSGEWERIESIASYVQGLQYVSIQTGLARGGGYRPHTAADVFSKSYGDCKGKANLLRTMLREAGIRAHLVMITSDDPDYVREEWPSPYQFNHCIIAIAVSDTVRAPGVTQVGTERLLLFDPTDSSTPLGQIPFLEQGSLALVACGSSSALIRVPRSEAADHGVEHTIRGTVGADGALVATLLQHSRGGEASKRRWQHRSLTPTDYRKAVETWISGIIPGAAVSKVEVKDRFRENRFSLEIELRASRYARMLPGGLLAVKPLTLEGSAWGPGSGERRMPLLLPSSMLSERTELRVPDGYAVEECSEPVAAEAPFGTFHTSCELDGSTLRLRRDLELKRSVVPAGKYASASKFFDRVRSASQASVVLAPATPPAPASSP